MVEVDAVRRVNLTTGVSNGTAWLAPLIEAGIPSARSCAVAVRLAFDASAPGFRFKAPGVTVAPALSLRLAACYALVVDAQTSYAAGRFDPGATAVVVGALHASVAFGSSNAVRSVCSATVICEDDAKFTALALAVAQTVSFA